MIQPWKLLGSRHIENLSIARIRADKKISPRNGVEYEFIVLDCPNWVNVIALTPDRHLIMVEQFRHGTNTVELEIPGGVMDASDHLPLDAGLRELREETGYTGEKACIIGKVFPNPAIMNNTCYTVLVENCTRTHDVAMDHTEDIQTRLVPLDEAFHLLREGHIRNSLVVVAFHFFRQWLA